MRWAASDVSPSSHLAFHIPNTCGVLFVLSDLDDRQGLIASSAMKKKKKVILLCASKKVYRQSSGTGCLLIIWDGSHVARHLSTKGLDPEVRDPFLCCAVPIMNLATTNPRRCGCTYSVSRAVLAAVPIASCSIA